MDSAKEIDGSPADKPSGECPETASPGREDEDAPTDVNGEVERAEHTESSVLVHNGTSKSDPTNCKSEVDRENVGSSSGPANEIDAVLQEEDERLNKLSLPNDDDDLKVPGKAKMQINKEHQYKRLIELLTKSQFYTDFLVKKLKSESSEAPKSRKGRRMKGLNGQDSEGVNEASSSGPSPKAKGLQSGSAQVLAIAANVLSSKKSKNEEAAPEEVVDEEPEPSLTKTLENGLVVPLDQPLLLSGACLRDYQMEGLNWLKLLFENGVNGILADEMGLGKTIQVIALIAHLIEKNVKGPFLIIGPLSTLPNWAIEFERFTPQIPFILYHGNEEKRAKAWKKVSQKHIIEGHKVYPVVITSYDYPLRDVKVMKKLNWRYIIIDEGHRLKNHNSQLSRALRKYQSANRLLLTGTPLHNSLSELWALLNFLVPEIFDDLEIFESWFNLEDLSREDGSEKVLEEEKKTKILSTMHKILSPFMLRRVKADVNLNLPPKKELVVYAPMTPIQLDLYKAVLDYNFEKLTNKPKELEVIDNEDGSRPKRACTTTKKFYVLNELFRLEDEMEAKVDDDDKKALVVQDKENKEYAIRVKMQNTGMMMRKIVNHPYLIQYPLQPGTEYARIDEDVVTTSGKLLVLDAMLTKLKERGHKVLLFSTFTSLIDILEDYLSLRSFKYVRLDGNTNLDDRQVSIKDFNSDPELFLFLISTRAGGLGINLAAADTVILYDSDWNPQVDLQAQDRCHRIGQTRPVVVYRFVTAGTVDEQIVVRAAAKRKLEKIIIHKGNYSSFHRQEDSGIDLEELRRLLNSRDHERVIHPNGFVFSDEELDKLLDRSDLLEGKKVSTSCDASDIQARPFKEYYGYTGTKDQKSINVETKCNAQIVDQDSSDDPFKDSSLPVKRSPVKKVNCIARFASSFKGDDQADSEAEKEIEGDPSRPSKRDSEHAIGNASKKFKEAMTSSQKASSSNSNGNRSTSSIPSSRKLNKSSRR